MVKEKYTHDTRALCVHDKRALYACQKSPICMTKEPYMHDKRALYAWYKSPMFLTKEPYIYDKKALYS